MLTVVAGSGRVPDLQCPLSAGILVPGVCAHEGPVVEALRRVVMGSAGAGSTISTDRGQGRMGFTWVCMCVCV